MTGRLGRAPVGGVLLLVLLSLPLWHCARENPGLKKLDATESSLQAVLATVQRALSDGDAPTLSAKGDELIRLRVELAGLKLKAKEENLRQALEATLDACIDASLAGSRGISRMKRGQALEDSIRAVTPRTSRLDLSPAVRRLQEASVYLEQCQNALTKAGTALAKAHEERATLAGKR